MTDDYVRTTQCQDCDASYKNHRWGQTKAHSDGWFTKKDGTAWCPNHIPDWVEGWRKRQSKGQ